MSAITDALGTAASSAAPGGIWAQVSYGLAYGAISAWFDIADQRAHATSEAQSPDDAARIARARALVAGLPRPFPIDASHPKP